MRSVKAGFSTMRREHLVALSGQSLKIVEAAFTYQDTPDAKAVEPSDGTCGPGNLGRGNQP